MDTSNKKTRKTPKRKHRQGITSKTLASYTVTCLNCGFNYTGQLSSCPKCGTRKGELV